jgi:hypothetical protein
MKPVVPKPQRCAIYTRKSTEHNPAAHTAGRLSIAGGGAKSLFDHLRVFHWPGLAQLFQDQVTGPGTAANSTRIAAAIAWQCAASASSACSCATKPSARLKAACRRAFAFRRYQVRGASVRSEGGHARVFPLHLKRFLLHLKHRLFGFPSRVV